MLAYKHNYIYARFNIYNSKSNSLKSDLIPVTNGKGQQVKSILADIRSIAYAVIFGMLFGFFMNKGTVFVSPTIRMQMLFQRFAMLKMFLAAVGASMLSVAALCTCYSQLYQKIFNGYVEHNCRRGCKYSFFAIRMIDI